LANRYRVRAGRSGCRAPLRSARRSGLLGGRSVPRIGEVSVTIVNGEAIDAGGALPGKARLRKGSCTAKRMPNDLIRQARLALRSPSGSGRPMSRQELAEAVNAWVYERNVEPPLPRAQQQIRDQLAVLHSRAMRVALSRGSVRSGIPCRSNSACHA
jgi:hypothetical protein